MKRGSRRHATPATNDPAANAALVLAQRGDLSTELRAALANAQAYARNSRAQSTLGAYASDWRLFLGWCARHNLAPLPASPQTVVLYMAQLADGTAFPDERPPRGRRRPSTIARHLATISVAHRLAKFVSPYDDEAVQSVLEGIRREHGVAPNKKTAAVAEVVRSMAETPREDGDPAVASALVLRDRAILLVGFGGAFRRSELAELCIENVEFRPEGMLLTLRWSKTDQRGEGRTVRIAQSDDAAFCPVAALRAWLDELASRGVRSGEVFRSLSRRNMLKPLTGETIADTIKLAAERIRRDPAAFGGHSLRSGHVTSAIRAGKRLDTIQKQTGHKILETLLGYLEREGSWDDNSSKGLI